MTVVQQRNADHIGIEQSDFLPLSDRNIFYERYGTTNQTTAFTTAAVSVPLPNLRHTIGSFGTVFEWDSVNHVLTINQSGLYQFYWRVGVWHQGSNTTANYTSYIDQSTNGGSSYTLLPASEIPTTSYVGSDLAATFSNGSGSIILRVLAGYKHRLRLYRIGGTVTLYAYGQYCNLGVVQLIGTPAS